MNKVTRTHTRVNAQCKFEKKTWSTSAITFVQQCTHRSVIQIDKRWKDFFFAMVIWCLLIVISKLWPIYSMLFTIHFMRNIFASHYCYFESWKKERARKEKKITLKVCCKLQVTSFDWIVCALFSLSFTIVIIDFFYHLMEWKKINFLKLVAKTAQKKTWNFVKYGFQVNLKYTLWMYSLRYVQRTLNFFPLPIQVLHFTKYVPVHSVQIAFLCVCLLDVVVQVEPFDNRSPHLR